ncbi:response regulator [Desulfosarcina sp.]|uniref:response regulator n=1 Tax=Desulfosarcina sp. TaxID=2027861 RepID=UPI003568E4F1
MQDDAMVVMLVEDNPAHAEIIIRLLKENRITVQIRHVSDGEAALDYLFRRGAYADRFTYPEPHLILLDLRLPKVDGLEVLRQIKASERLRLLPVVVLSSSAAHGDIAAAYRQHVNSYLVKPVDYNQFVVLMENLVSYWLTLNRHPQP